MATVLDRAQSAGVQKVLLTGMSLGDVEVNLSLARTRPSACILITPLNLKPMISTSPTSVEP
jgi:Tat protein secretion system quality control protein TatD with DNase activity